MKKANHQANIVRITEIKPHTNADTLVIIPIGEYQVVSKMGQFNVGDLAVYIQPDSVVPQTEPFRFIWEPYLCEGDVVPERRRRITVRKFRKEWSEGLLLPVSDFPILDFSSDAGCSPGDPKANYQGEDVSDLLGITHYDPDAGKEDGADQFAPKLKKKYPRSIRGWVKFLYRHVRNFFGVRSSNGREGVQENSDLGIPVYDVDALKNYKNTFVDGEKVRVTEKIHGSNARYLFLEGKMYAGSRKLWKSENSTCAFRRILREQPWIEEWCREHEGYVLWGELTPTQKGFDYGSKELQFFVFDILGPDGRWLEDDHEFRVQLQAHSVPLLYKGDYYKHVIDDLVSGPSKLGKHIREGVVVTTIPERHVVGLGRAQLKVVSNEFLEKDSK